MNLKHVLSVMFATFIALFVSTSCGNSSSIPDEPDYPPQVGAGQWTDEAIFTVEANDTLNINERTYSIPSTADEFIIEVYSIGLGHAEVWKVQKGMNVELVDTVNINSDGLSDAAPVEWAMPSCMTDAIIKERLRPYNFYKQRVKVTIDKSVAAPRELRIYLEARSHKEFFGCTSCVNVRQE